MTPRPGTKQAFRSARTLIALAGAVAAATLAAGGCSTRNPYADPFWAYAPQPGASVPSHFQASPYQLAVFRGDNGQSIDWNGLWNGIRWADIVIVGEQHDDASAHEVQRAIAEETFAAWPGCAVSLEMLERNEQPIVDAYLRGEITKDEFVTRTNSRDWASKGSWDDFYQPVIDAAKDAGAPVIAANAPREYVRRARTEGYEALAALPPEERANFSIPAGDPPATYRQRFKDLMSGDGAHQVSDAQVDDVLRSQRMWDATMAESIVKAWNAAPSGGKVVHLVGQFHSEYDGGLVSEIQHRAPTARILTISVQKGEAYVMRAEDRGKADVVVYGIAPRPTWTGFNAGLTIPKGDAIKVPSIGIPAGAPAPEEPLPTWGFAY
jgi:uncharacterized iron-regulated protein